MSNSLVPRLSGGELYDLVREVDQMSEDEARYLLRQILSVLCYLLLKLDGHHSVLLVPLIRCPGQVPESCDYLRLGYSQCASTTSGSSTLGLTPMTTQLMACQRATEGSAQELFDVDHAREPLKALLMSFSMSFIPVKR